MTTTLAKETWEVRVASKITLTETILNRANQPSPQRLVLGPNQIGRQFRISSADRIDNQDMVADRRHDPFTNGMLRRVDGNQQDDPATASENVLSADQIVDILDLNVDELMTKVETLNEIAVTQILDIAKSVGASYEKVTSLEEYLHRKFRVSKPQKSIFSARAENQ